MKAADSEAAKAIRLPRIYHARHRPLCDLQTTAMKFLVVLLLLTSCVKAEKLTLREYDAGAFFVKYKAPAKVDPVFTHISLSLADRADGAVYITADQPRGLFGTSPGGKSFSIYIVPSDRFSLSHPNLGELVSSLPPRLKANHPRETFSAQLFEVAPRQWCEVISHKADSAEIITGVAYYSFIDSETILYASWIFSPSITSAKFSAEEPDRLEILRGFEVRQKDPHSKTLLRTTSTPTPN